ncbi:MAG: low molecular weight protein-tyrosine-phosphatase [Burkholderiales bacterium]
MRVLFVCMGNICRSPTAEAVFRHRVEEAGLQEVILVDSAGTHDYHVGCAPDHRAQAAAALRGLDMSGLRARKFIAGDIGHFDHLFALDGDNLREMRKNVPESHAGRVRLFMDFSAKYRGQEVPDPYYGRADGFEVVLDMVEDASAGLLSDIRKNYGI